MLIALGVATMAGAQPLVTRVSVASDGAQGDDLSGLAALSADGRYVAFASYASNLVSGDTNDDLDVFVRDRQAGTTTRVSLSSGGAEADCASWPGAMSATGRLVVFTSCASNLVTSDTNGEDDVFLRDRDTDADGIFDEPDAVATTRISVGTGGEQGDAYSEVDKLAAISADGRYVVFESWATTLVPGDAQDHKNIFVRDVVLGTTTLLSVATDGTRGNYESFYPTISSSGRFVAFTSGASNLVAGDTNETRNCYGAQAGPLYNCHDVFVRDRDTDDDGIFDEPGAVSITRVSVATDGTQANDMSGVAAISGDGRFVAFHSWATNLVPGDTNGSDDLFVHDRQTGATTKVANIAAGANAQNVMYQVDVSLSADGGLIAFTSGSWTLVPGDTNGVADIFVYDRLAGTTRRVSLSHDGEESDDHSMMPMLSTDGTVIAWTSEATNLVPGDTNASWDVFAGEVAEIAPKDTDTDGLPDSWEKRFGLKTDSSTDGNGPDDDPDHDGIANEDELAAGTHPRGFVLRYLAEGATNSHFETQIALLNVTDTAASVNLRHLPGVGAPVTYAMTIPPRTRRTIDAGDVSNYVLEDAEFSTVVESDTTVVVDRTMAWNGHYFWMGCASSHAETAVAGPALTWYLAEGATHSGFDLFYLLQNPNTQAAEVEVTFLLPEGTPIVHTYTIEPTRRFNIWVDLLPGLENTDVSAVIRVTNEQPIIVERAMYLSRPATKESPGSVFAAAHESAGITEPATTWFLAEGNTGPYFDLFVLIANPTDADAQVRATYLLWDGTTLQKLYTVGRHSRYNIWVDLEDAKLANTAVSTTLESLNDVPIIVERAMWWPGDFTTWHEAHNSPGATTTGTTWAMAEGEVGVEASPGSTYEMPMDTFILVANTSTNEASTKVTLLFEDGTSAVRTFTVKPTSRFNVWVRVEFPEAVGKRFGTIVESLGDAPAQLVVERAMYSDAFEQKPPTYQSVRVPWANGTNALAVKLK